MCRETASRGKEGTNRGIYIFPEDTAIFPTCQLQRMPAACVCICQHSARGKMDLQSDLLAEGQKHLSSTLGRGAPDTAGVGTAGHDNELVALPCAHRGNRGLFPPWHITHTQVRPGFCCSSSGAQRNPPPSPAAAGAGKGRDPTDYQVTQTL